MIGLIYFVVIVLANTVGAISGMGGGVLIKPILDLIGAHSVAGISFYSTVAVFTMSIVSTVRQVSSGKSLNWQIVGWVSSGAVVGGVVGNIVFEVFLQLFENEKHVVQLIQIFLTVLTLVFAFFYTKHHQPKFHLTSWTWYLICGGVLGFLASFLGIGGGPVNVSLLMLMFALPIKEATLYSLSTIFFSQLAKLVTIALTSSFMRFDLSMLFYVIPAAVIGGLWGARFSRVLSPKKVTFIFQAIVIVVLLINLYNAFVILQTLEGSGFKQVKITEKSFFK
ncbi:TPA: sulfite exporter TauE/SafE family protein [Enterococcus faecium]|nr:sulfite exporter TauE/SafE family protein [Enterococcus faecium]